MYPYALSINYPAHSAHALGYKESNLFLAEQPKTREEAINWTRWLLQHGYTVSIGLMQVNIEVAPALHIQPATLFEPCTNLAAAARILAFTLLRGASPVHHQAAGGRHHPDHIDNGPGGAVPGHRAGGRDGAHG